AAELAQVLTSQAIDLVLASPSQGIPLQLAAQHIAASGKDFAVTLPTVSKNTLATAGAVAGRTPFAINLTKCSAGKGMANRGSRNRRKGRLRSDRGRPLARSGVSPRYRH
ncbi:fimbrial protein, partial [Stenotrophomonas sp. 3diitr2024]|uniref:fimbrial protein n=1 Tax=Stenotrophomonas sp. 3diitr2024 TaxID=3345115 RepID=UPI0035CC38E9